MAMIRCSFALLVMAWLCIGVTFHRASAAIQLQSGDRVRYERDLEGTTIGGVFEFYHYESGERFRTFCLEMEQGLPGTDYYITIDQSMNSSGRSVSDYGKWTYQQYVNGSLPGQGTLSSDRVADSVQLGLWDDMGYSTLGYSGFSGPTWEQYRADRYGEMSAQYLDGSDAHTIWQDAYTADLNWVNENGGQFVQLMQLWRNADLTGAAQDMVFSLVDGEVVPEPATLAVWSVLGAGALLAGRLRRRRRV